MPCTPGKEQAVVIYSKNVVVFGYTEDTTTETITLRNARMCVYWSDSMKGVLGLAARGPDAECRISEPVPSLDIRTGQTDLIMTATDIAVKQWEKAPWK